MDLTTRYLGLDLRNPLVASPSPLTSTVDGDSDDVAGYLVAGAYALTANVHGDGSYGPSVAAA